MFLFYLHHAEKVSRMPLVKVVYIVPVLLLKQSFVNLSLLLPIENVRQ